MGLTNSSVGLGAIDTGLHIVKNSPQDKVIAVAGNPNVGKSTVFNALTGMKQHTGNWPGKTVAGANGLFRTDKFNYIAVDIPGTYSLEAHSAEEEIARDFICFSSPDAVVVVCDATCLERNMNLVLQIAEAQSNVIVCVNLLDEAKRKNITVNLELLQKRLQLPVVGVVARKKKSLGKLTQALDSLMTSNKKIKPFRIRYPEPIEEAIKTISSVLGNRDISSLNGRWLALKLLDGHEDIFSKVTAMTNGSFTFDEELKNAVDNAKKKLSENNITAENISEIIVSAVISNTEIICNGVIIHENPKYYEYDRKIDRIITGKLTAFPIMILFIALIFWLTISLSNYPSELLARLFAFFGREFNRFFLYINAPENLRLILIDGVWSVLSKVVSVMLPPMAIFFPLFTLLEDSGFLPRIAYNLDKPFRKCNACGKQSLTMCMGFGCNASGIVGCRIIDSPRERLLAVITNNFVPCNGRFPMLIAVITMFFVSSNGFSSTVVSALILTAVILLGIGATFLSTKILSSTVLKGTPSSFTLELPPYRKPQILKVIVRSIFDRTLFVLGRAVVVAAPAGLIIWLAANIKIGNVSILSHCAQFLDPFANLMGLDGVILIAFILGFPANEIVVPIIIMAYTVTTQLQDFSSLDSLKELLIANGWTSVTAISMMIFSLMHWPCSTALITIKKETASLKWTAISVIVPTVTGIILCMLFNFFAQLIV